MSKRIKIYTSILIVLLIVIAGYIFWPKDGNMTNIANNKSEYVDINAKEAYELITENEDLIIIDVSPRFDEGHIPNSLNYYVGDGSLDKALPSLNKDETYLVYCHVDSASIPGAQKLVDAGFTNVYRLEGNYPLWLEEGYPIEVGLKSVNNFVGSGLAIRSFIDGEYKHTVNAQLMDPQSGKFYEGWLVNGKSFFSTGKLIKVDDEYVLNYVSKEDKREYKQVVITEETEVDGLDNKPETHVLEGEFE